MEFYSHTFKKPNGETVSLSEYKGKVILVVNTATACGLTPQLKGLEKLHQAYQDQGLVVLGFPCNQFGGQEPLKNEELEESCLLNYGVTFQLSEKVKVNGKEAHPLFKYLKKKLRSGLFTSRIKWNFGKFIIDRNGVPTKRYLPNVKPLKIEEEIKKLIAK